MSKMPAIIGYAHVSTADQDHASQIEALRAAGAEVVYSEKQSGAKSDRRELRKAIAALTPGATLMVTRLDRLARSTRDLLNLLHEVEQRGATFKSLADTWCDTTTPHGKLLTQMLGSIAEFERTLITQRCDVGRERAKAAGVKFGRKPKLNTFQTLEAIKRRDAGEHHRDIARTYGVSHSTITRLRA
jgi:DNA invertase Pin-like site-specific DNA recombinase